MSQTSLLLPVFVQVALTFVLMVMSGRARVAALKSGAVKIRDVALGQNNWPERSTQIARAFQNQLETPPLFYALVAFILITQKNDAIFVAAAWAYVACRLAHAFIHTTTNRIQHRFAAFLASIIVLGLMWIVFGVRLAIG